MENISNSQSLALISEMINKAKNNFSENGTLFILWGIVISFCSLFHFIGAVFLNESEVAYIWHLTWITGIVQIIYLIKTRKNSKVKTYTGNIIDSIWLVFSLSSILMVSLLLYQLQFSSVFPALLIMYGIPTILSGTVFKFKPLILGGISCWLLSIGSVFAGRHYHLLFIAAAAILAWLIPGIYLRQKYNQLKKI